jgi:hypothetical protein
MAAAVSIGVAAEVFGVDPDDVTVTRKAYTPTEEQFQRYLAREKEIAANNVRLLARQYGVRVKVTVTNGREPGKGYCAIRVWRDGPTPEDTMHSLTTFSSAVGSLRREEGGQREQG